MSGKQVGTGPWSGVSGKVEIMPNTRQLAGPPPLSSPPRNDPADSDGETVPACCVVRLCVGARKSLSGVLNGVVCCGVSVLTRVSVSRSVSMLAQCAVCRSLTRVSVLCVVCHS